MAGKLIECVPNFSEGRNQQALDAITDALKGTPGVSVIGVDPGKSTNRTVFTFVGSPDAVINGAFNAAKVALQKIDMTKHSGEHPRLGAMDVCPFVPVRNATMEDCVDCANKLGKKLGDALGIPIYLYGAAAVNDYRRTVPQIRQGEYEGLKDKVDSNSNSLWLKITAKYANLVLNSSKMKHGDLTTAQRSFYHLGVPPWLVPVISFWLTISTCLQQRSKLTELHSI